MSGATRLAMCAACPLRVLVGWSSRSEVTLARTTVDPVDLRREADGSLLIPFRIPPLDEADQWRPREVRLRVRTASWPVGWGATFLIVYDL